MPPVKTATKPPEAATLPAAEPVQIQAGDSNVQELKVTGHMMALPAGLFCFVNEANPASARHHGLPGVRVSPPPTGGQNVEITGFRADGWLNATGDAALVRVRKSPGHVLVTIYQLQNQTDSPRLQVRQLLGGTAEQPVPAQAAAPTPPPAPTRVDIMAHIQSRGDVGTKFGEWLGERGSNNWIEGFAISAPEGIDPADLSYQAVLGRGWLSPWMEAGAYCGSRGMALPLLGLRIRLGGEAADHFEISYAASFIGGATAGPVGNDETCEGDTLAPLESFQVTLTPRTRKPGKKR